MKKNIQNLFYLLLTGSLLYFGCGNDVLSEAPVPETFETIPENPQPSIVDDLVITGKAPTVNSTVSRAAVTGLVNDVTNYYTIENGILDFDTVRGPAYTINLNTKSIIYCSSSGTMSRCEEVSKGIWEITLYSTEFPNEATYRFAEAYQTTKKVIGSGGTASDSYSYSSGSVSYSDGTSEMVELEKNSGIVKLWYLKGEKVIHKCETTLQNLLNFGVRYTENNLSGGDSEDQDEDNEDDVIDGWIRLDSIESNILSNYRTAYYKSSDFSSIVSFSNGKADWEGKIYYTDSSYKTVKSIDFDGSNCPNIIVDAANGKVVYYSMAGKNRLCYRVCISDSFIETDIKSLEFDSSMEKYFTVKINLLKSDIQSQSADWKTVILTSNGTEIATVKIPRASYGICEVIKTTISGLTCEGQFISENEYAISTYINGAWVQNKHRNWVTPQKDTGGMNISDSGEGGSTQYNIRYSFVADEELVQSDAVYRLYDLKSGLDVTYNSSGMIIGSANGVTKVLVTNMKHTFYNGTSTIAVLNLGNDNKFCGGSSDGCLTNWYWFKNNTQIGHFNNYE